VSHSVFVRRTRIEAPAAEVFRWHARPGALERLTPPWAPIHVVERTGGIAQGARVVLDIPVGPTSIRWIAQHVDYEEGRLFRDVQVEGPFTRWEHTHRFEAPGPTVCVLEDRIEYELPFGPVGELLGTTFVRRMLERTFTFRHRITAQDVHTHMHYGGNPLHFAVSGSTGLIGSALVPFLTTGGHHVTRLARGTSATHGDAIRWDPASGSVDSTRLDPIDVVVHLAGENVASGRWTEARKAQIRDSRATPTRRLCETLARLDPKPRTLVCASAIGYYGNRGADELDEKSSAGRGFMADVCRAWEAATEPAAAAGIRVVHLRIGVVLTAAGGALAKLLPPFKLGLGGRLGNGGQYMSWIARDDILGAILHVARTDALRGAVNAVAPNAVTNQEFTATLGTVLHRPTLLPIPAAAARLALGEMADEMLLASTRVRPSALTQSGYVFRQPDLAGALRHTLGK
jgi:uncharacterized protein